MWNRFALPSFGCVGEREYESWFVAAAKSLHGQRGFVFDDKEHIDPENPRDAKGWLGTRMATGTYRQTTDQPAFSQRMDLQQAFDQSRSFRKLCSEWSKQIV